MWMRPLRCGVKFGKQDPRLRGGARPELHDGPPRSDMHGDLVNRVGQERQLGPGDIVFRQFVIASKSSEPARS